MCPNLLGQSGQHLQNKGAGTVRGELKGTWDSLADEDQNFLNPPAHIFPCFLGDQETSVSAVGAVGVSGIPLPNLSPREMLSGSKDAAQSPLALIYLP